MTLGERTRARRIESRFGDVLIETDGGARVRAGAAAVAINAASAGLEPLRPRLAVTSTHMIATEPVPDLLERIGWTGGECVSTARRHLHYFRTTADGRIAFGWGGGRLAYGARLGGRVEVDPAVVERLRADILRFFPGLRGRRVDAAWAGRSMSPRPICPASARSRAPGSTTSAASPATASLRRTSPARRWPRLRSGVATGSRVGPDRARATTGSARAGAIHRWQSGARRARSGGGRRRSGTAQRRPDPLPDRPTRAARLSRRSLSGGGRRRRAPPHARRRRPRD